MMQMNGKIYMLLDYKNQYCQNGWTTQGNLQIHRFNTIPIKIQVAFFFKEKVLTYGQ